jgi:glycerol-3-phosphate acyltransferase PlsY
MKTAALFFLPVGAYLLGAIPWGLVLARVFTGTDIRRQGSGNIGATNVRRLAGNRLGALTLFLDAAKGALPVYLSLAIVPVHGAAGHAYSSLVALSAIVGHIYPIYLKFKDGGKGVATAAGCFAVMTPTALMVAVVVFVLAVGLTRRVSAGSLTSSATLPLWVWQLTASIPWTLCGLLTTVLIIHRHRDNIARLAAGKEPRI